MNFLKNLFSKKPAPPVPQAKLNLGKLTAKVSLRNGEVLKYSFIGKYYESHDYCCLGGKALWIDDYTTAQNRFDKWKKTIAETNFLQNGEKFIPFSEIAEINIEEREHVVETTRSL